MTTWLERYRSGDHIQVWTEMVGVGASIRGQASELQDASAVAVETMRRARTNVERLTESLPAVGYVFEAGPDQPAFEPRTRTSSSNSTDSKRGLACYL